ncbi:MAG: helix-turn-helix domain-containing protein [Xanthomonadales bacterium]|nr:helix-turn-helix domain-containing protein [Xanthomonadales bacterium]
MTAEIHRAVVVATPDGRVDTEGAATYLGVAAGTLQNWRAAGRGPAFVTIGRRVMYRTADLDAFIVDRPIKPATELGRERALVAPAHAERSRDRAGS